ncbi:MAG: hypothetical protein ACKO6K_06275 [Chitinophagaceae bacterium]
MKKIFCLTGWLWISHLALQAQSNQSVFIELGANGMGLSANYDARFSKSEKGLGFRVVVGFVPGLDLIFIQSSSFLTIPFGLNYLIGKAPHYVEAGLGSTYVNGVSIKAFGSETDKKNAFGMVPSVGYRYASAGKGVQFRIVVSPFIGSGGAAFYGGLSLGFQL